MPAPPAIVLKAAMTAALAGFGGDEMDPYLTALTKEINKQWSLWIGRIKWGNNLVTGAGVGGWGGVGIGGGMDSGMFLFSPSSVIEDAGMVETEHQLTFLEGLGDVLDEKFNNWAEGYKFAGVPYVGTCTATGVSPGQFQARNTPLPLLLTGSGPLPTGISTALSVKLVAGGFDLEESMVLRLTAAIGNAITAGFTLFLSTTLASRNSVRGAAAPGGVGSAKSKNDGKLV